MPRKTFHFPKVLRLGQGSKIFVRVISADTLQGHYDASGTLVKGAACWEEASQTIWISDALTQEQRWRAYWHELLHAVHDLGLASQGGV